MADLILTDEEKALPFWNDLDDAALGKAIKKCGVKWLTQKRENDNNVDGAMDNIMKAATVAMCCRAHEMDADTWELTLFDVTLKGQNIGKWRVLYERIDKEELPE